MTDVTPPVDQLAAALAQAQAELPKIVKDQTAQVATKSGGSYSYSYADLSAVTEAVLPVLSRHGLAWVTMPTLGAEQRFVLRYTLLHTSGQSMSGEYPLPMQGGPQDLGSAITYARRYALCSVTGVAPADDDDDAARAQGYRQPPPGWDTPPPDGGYPATSLRGQAQSRPITDSQSKRMHALFTAAGMTDREDRLAYVNATIDREVSTSKDLTTREAATVITALERDAAQDTEETGNGYA